MFRALALIAFLGVSQPAAAIQMVEIVRPADASCAAGDPSCAAQAQQRAAKTADPERRASSGSVVAGLVGILVLGLVFGRRKGGLPEVVS